MMLDVNPQDIDNGTDCLPLYQGVALLYTPSRSHSG